jgi:hypothetical protein
MSRYHTSTMRLFDGGRGVVGWPRGRPTRAFAAAAAMLLSVFAPTRAIAQSERPVVLAVGTQALTVPWHPGPVAAGWNPAFMAGTDHTFDSNGSWRFFFGLNLGVFRNQWWMTGVSLEPEVGIGRAMGEFTADVRLGLGYMHYFWRRRPLELEGGRYTEAPNRGRPSLLVPLSLTLGYRGDSDDPVTVQPFVSARWALQGLFLPEIPAVSHLFLLGGVRLDASADPEGGGP